MQHGTTKHYPKESAGRIMLPVAAVPTALASETVGVVEARVATAAPTLTTINYIYVVDAHARVVGALSIRELLQHPKTTALVAIMTAPVITVRAHTDQERVAHLAIEHNLKAVPVVDQAGVLLGVVGSDAILSTLHHEHTEDVLRFAGVSRQHDVRQPLWRGSVAHNVRVRLPWLLVGLGGGMLAALVVEWFEATLAVELALAAFIPAVVYMADAVGSQTQMLFVRALTVATTLNLRSYIAREVAVNITLGLVLAVVVYALSFAWLAHPALSTTLAVAIFMTVCSTVVVAITLPYVLFKRGFDPAIASGPLATVLRDIMSLCIYFAVAVVVMS